MPEKKITTTENLDALNYKCEHPKQLHRNHRKHTSYLNATKPQQVNLLLPNKHKPFKYAFQNHFLFPKLKPHAYLKFQYVYLN